MLPQELIGAFRRSGLIVGGQRKVDFVDVVWLQTPEWFVDTRLLINRQEAPSADDVPASFYSEKVFAGTATWERPNFTWEHLFDSHQRTKPDSNQLFWEDGVIVERGMTMLNGQAVTFAEEWLRMTPDNVEWHTDVRASGVRVEVGRFAAEVLDERPSGGSFTASRLERSGESWTVIGTYTLEGI